MSNRNELDELDTIIAEWFGYYRDADGHWQWPRPETGEGPHESAPPGSMLLSPPAYSRVIPAAWEVVEEMERRGYHLSLMQHSRGVDVIFRGVPPKASRSGFASAATVPLAICKAALTALEQQP